MEQAIIDQLRKGDDSLFKEFYLDEMERFVGWCRADYQLSEDDSHDLYQESQMYLYENVMHDRLLTLQSKLSTYLYAIAKNQLRLKYRKLTTVQKHEEQLTEHLIYLTDNEELSTEKKGRVEKISTEINRMLEPCRSLLILFYYENLGFKEIAVRMGYKNPDVAKNQKKRCLDKLRTATQN